MVYAHPQRHGLSPLFPEFLCIKYQFHKAIRNFDTTPGTIQTHRMKDTHQELAPLETWDLPHARFTRRQGRNPPSSQRHCSDKSSMCRRFDNFELTIKVATPGQGISIMKGRWEGCVWAVSCLWRYIFDYGMFCWGACKCWRRMMLHFQLRFPIGSGYLSRLKIIWPLAAHISRVDFMRIHEMDQLFIVPPSLSWALMHFRQHWFVQRWIGEGTYSACRP